MHTSSYARLWMLAGSLSAAVIISCQQAPISTAPISLDELRLVVSQPRELGYTNKKAGFLYTMTHGQLTSGWQGWHIFSRKVLDDWMFALDGTALRRDEVREVEVYPHLFIRHYSRGVRETVALLDSTDALIVELEGLAGDTLSVWPLFGESLTRADLIQSERTGAVFFARSHHTKRTGTNEPPPWIGMRLVGGSKHGQPREGLSGEAGRFAPGGLSLSLQSDRATLLLVGADSPDDGEVMLDRLEGDYPARVASRRERMEAVLRRSFLRTNDRRFDLAMHWAMLSLDALMMEQGRPGIFAGLPWFSNYWGRDTFISLPGATLVTGRTEEARDILASFAAWQETDPGSPSYGRIPNLVTPTSIAYNTADGTPWFVLALHEYFLATGDSAFIRSMMPVITRSVLGTITHHTNQEGFLTHGDAETWMDAVGPQGPWTPRGTCANDIQSLWYRQLQAAASLVEDTVLEGAWRDRADRLRRAFLHNFIDSTTGLIVDHLNAEGTRDSSLRPNLFFVFASPELVVDPSRLFHAATPRLVYPHGVASLAPDDQQFHPFHHYEPFYVQDAAYHNGIVWTWLAGPWIDAAVQLDYQDLAFSLTKNMTHQILDRGAVGTLSELLDAVPRQGESEPRLSGTFTQAWSLAEYIRVMYQDYLGIEVNVPSQTLTLRPRLPEDITQVNLHIRFGQVMLPIEMGHDGSKHTLAVTLPPLAPAVDLEGDVLCDSGMRRHFAAQLTPGTTNEFVVDERGVVQRTGGGSDITEEEISSTRVVVQTVAAPKFADSELPPHVPALSGIHHRLLSHSEIKAANPHARVVCEARDPEGDDTGTGTYIYPLTSHLKPGSLDLKQLRISVDSSNTHFELTFRRLSNPGWHPEYGFQLTLAAVAIDKDHKEDSGGRNPGLNSNYTFPRDAGYEYLILVGGGVRLYDGRNALLAEYVPESGDENDPLGDAQRGVIRFSIPRTVMDAPDAHARVSVLVGAQDDHGGAGIGEFRAVEAKAGEWVGGGRRRPTDPNVYDTLIIE